MGRHIAISAAVSMLGLAFVWFGLRGTSSSAPPTDAPEAPRQVRAPARTVLPMETQASEPDLPSPSPTRVAIHERARRVISERIRVVVPDDASASEAFDLQMDVVDLRSTELDDLIVDLAELAETTRDASTRAEALVSLAEVYVELAEVISSTPIPDWVRPRRAVRLEQDIADRAAIALDQAQMVAGIAAAAGMDAEQSRRMDAVIEALE